MEYSVLATTAKIPKDTTSPILAAKGVARLSGFIFIFRAKNITPINIKSVKKFNYHITQYIVSARDL